MEFTPSWGVERVWNEYNYYNTGEPAADKYAFVIDSGCSLETNDLNVNTQWAKSFVSSTTNPFQDDMGHGTAVASVIGAKADNHGLTGVAPGAQIVPLKVFSAWGGTTNARVQDACRYAMEVILANDLVNDAVINLSLGGFGGDRHSIIEELDAAGIKVVIAAGNEAVDVDGISPASYGHLPNVYTVSSTTKNNYYSGFTNYDNDDEDDVDFAAPGSAIPVYRTDGTLKSANGTSFSAPHVAGLLLMGKAEAGPTMNLTDKQRIAGMVADPLSVLAPPDPIIEYIEVPVVEYVEIEKIIEVQPPQTTFVGDFNGRNTIRGSRRDDVIIGGSLNDRLKGSNGNDYIIGNGGVDKVRGGKGEDTFVCSFDGVMHIKDFDAEFDTLALPSDDVFYEINKRGNTNVYCEDTLIAKISGYI